MIVTSLLASCVYHIMSVFLPLEPEAKKIDSLISKAMWGVFTSKKYRVKIAKAKMELPLDRGGLGVWTTMRRATALFLNSMLRTAAYTKLNPDSNLARIRDFEDFPFYKFLNLFGSNSLSGSPKFIEMAFPESTVQRLHVVKDAVRQLELSPSFFFRSSLRQSVFATELSIADRLIDNRLTPEECTWLEEYGFVSIGDLLQRTFHKDKFVFNLNLIDRASDPALELPEGLIRKLHWLVGNVRKHIPMGKLTQLPSKRFKSSRPINTFFYHSIYENRFFFSKALKNLMMEQHQEPPPGLLTRERDGVETFDLEISMSSFRRVLNEKIPLSLKSLHIEFINRTLWSRNKLFKFGHAESPNCSICFEVATTEHCLFFCKFPSFCASKIADFLDRKLHGGVPHVHLAREKLFLHCIYIDELPSSICGQVMNLILSLKKSCLEYAAEEKWLSWSSTVWYAQLFSHIRKTVAQRLFLNLPVNLLNEMLEALTIEFSESP